MSKAFLITFAAAAAVIGGLVWSGFVSTRGNHLDPTGKIGKVRIQAATEDLTIVVLDFSVTNDSDRPMQVSAIDAMIEMPDGSGLPAEQIPSPDLPKIFKAFPLLGEQYNEPLHLREQIAPHASVDRMIALRTEAPEAVLNRRKRLVLRVTDVTGPVLELQK